jgi:hypothetical protein
MTKPKLLLKYLEGEGREADISILTDAWDVLICSSLDEIVFKFRAFNAPIVFNAERNCFPRADLAERFPTCSTPYRFLNSGFIVGQTEAMIEMLRMMKLDEQRDDFQRPDGTWESSNDQTEFQLFWLANCTKATLDTNAVICQTLHDAAPEEFGMEAGRVTSRLTGNQPSVFHGNGSGKVWLETIIGWLGL